MTDMEIVPQADKHVESRDPEPRLELLSADIVSATADIIDPAGRSTHPSSCSHTPLLSELSAECETTQNRPEVCSLSLSL